MIVKIYHTKTTSSLLSRSTEQQNSSVLSGVQAKNEVNSNEHQMYSIEIASGPPIYQNTYDSLINETLLLFIKLLFLFHQKFYPFFYFRLLIGRLADVDFLRLLIGRTISCH